MTARKIKTAAEIHKALLQLKEDMYFSFGVPRESSDALSIPGTHGFDPDVKVIYPDSLTGKQLTWARETSERVRLLLYQFSEYDTTRPKQVESKAERERMHTDKIAADQAEEENWRRQHPTAFVPRSKRPTAKAKDATP